MNGLAVSALVIVSTAIAVQVAAPEWWSVAFLMPLLGAVFFVGDVIMRSFRSRDYMVLPMVDLLRSDHDVVLDAGCGAGRTTIALSRILRNGRVVAVDRFDAWYIDDGGRELIERDLRAAGLTERVTMETADLTARPFDDASFDSAVRTNVYDHLGRNKEQALREMLRVLKPGGRFLMAVWVPGWAMFAVANALSFFLTSRAAWRAMARGAGFEVVDEGAVNHAWFVVLKKPAVPFAGRVAGAALGGLRANTHCRSDDRTPIPVRVIGYTLPGVPDAEPRYRLVTTLLDPETAPAAELAALYHERWEIEGAFDELKTHLRGARIVLRSKTPELVRQEAYGLLLAHFAVRGLMHEAALAAMPTARDPDTLSFVHAVRVARRTLPRVAALPP